MLLLSLTMGLIVSCHHSEEKEMDAVDSAIVDAGFPDEDGCTPVIVPCRCEGVPGRFPQASERKLEINDLKGLHRNDLAIVRNEILARHGYDFHDNQEMLDYFLQQPWYMPLFLNVDKVLTPLEKSNIKFVKEFEK